MGLANAMQQQQSIAASARGGGANAAMAQRAAANAAANLSGNAVHQSALLRAQEQLGAINAYGQQAAAYGQQAGAMRGQDQARAGLSGQLAGQQAGLEMQQTSANDVRNLAYEDARRDVIQTQMEARQRGEALNQGINMEQRNRDLQKRMHDDARTDRYIATGTTAGGAVLGTVFMPGPGTAAGSKAGEELGNKLSDIRAKTDIRSAGPEVDQAMDAMGDYRYRYRDQRDGRGMQVGPMAQELASTEAGRNAVARGQDGQLYIKGPEATGLTLAGLARLNERVRAIESQRSPGLGAALKQPREEQPQTGAGWAREKFGRGLGAAVSPQAPRDWSKDEQEAEALQSAMMRARDYNRASEGGRYSAASAARTNQQIADLTLLQRYNLDEDAYADGLGRAMPGYEEHAAAAHGRREQAWQRGAGLGNARR